MRGEADEGDEVGEDAFAASAFDLRFLQRGVGLPELGFVPEVGWLFDRVGQILDVLELQPLLVRLAVEDLQSGDLVFVLCDELFEGLHDSAGTGQGVSAEACFDDLILADVVDRQFVFLFDLDQEVAQLRIVERRDGLFDQLGRRRCDSLFADGFRGVCRKSCVELGPFGVTIRVHRFHQTTAQVFEREAAAGFADGLFIFLRDPVLHARQPSGDAGEHVFFGVPQRDCLEQLLKGDAGFFLHRSRVGLVLLADADGIDDDEVVFGRGVGRDGFADRPA